MESDHVTDYIRHAGSVRRYHAWPTIQVQTVGEHSWQVAMIYDQLFGALPPLVERYIRLHDVGELIVGDIPFPLKSLNPDLKAAFNRVEEVELKKRLDITLPELAPEVMARIKVCDLLEMMCFGMIDRELGSLLAIPIIRRTKQAALELARAKLQDSQCVAVYKFVDEANDRHTRVLELQAEWYHGKNQ